MKRTTLAVLAGVLLCLCMSSFGQSGNQAVKPFMRSGDFNGITLFFVHLNNKTVEVIFDAPIKYAMRAKANQSTMLYVQGIPERNTVLDTAFILEQEGTSQTCTVHDIHHFKKGSVVKGDRIDGILQFEKAIDVAKPFTLSNSVSSVEFKFNQDALQTLATPVVE